MRKSLFGSFQPYLGFLLPMLICSASAVTLDELQKQLKFEGESLIVSYKIDHTSAYVQLNPRMWNRLTGPEQRQICDKLVASHFVQDMKLLNAWFLVGVTDVGHIKPGLGGYSWVPAKS